MFCCVSYHLGAFWTIWWPYESWCKRGQTSAKVCATKSHWNFHNEHTRSTPLDPKLMFGCISYRLRAFGTDKLPYETRGKTFQTSAKVHATKLHRIISQRTHSIRPIGP